MRRHLGLAAALAPFVAAMALHADYIPVFDGLIYTERVVRAVLPAGSWTDLNCAGHLSIGALGPLALLQLPSPGSAPLRTLGNTLYGLLALVAFHGIVRAAFPWNEIGRAHV